MIRKHWFAQSKLLHSRFKILAKYYLSWTSWKHKNQITGRQQAATFLRYEIGEHVAARLSVVTFHRFSHPIIKRNIITLYLFLFIASQIKTVSSISSQRLTEKPNSRLQHELHTCRNLPTPGAQAPCVCVCICVMLTSSIYVLLVYSRSIICNQIEIHSYWWW